MQTLNPDKQALRARYMQYVQHYCDQGGRITRLLPRNRRPSVQRLDGYVIIRREGAHLAAPYRFRTEAAAMQHSDWRRDRVLHVQHCQGLPFMSA